MAEAFGFASGALSIAGFAGQLAQGAAFLHDFISDVRNAPSRVRALGEELRILESILANIQKSSTGQNADLEHALKYCEKRLNELLKFVKKVDPDQYARKRRRLWNQFKVALKRSDLTKYLGDLDRSKLMLLQACADITRDEQIGQLNQLQAVDKSLADVSAGQRACNAATGATKTTIEEIRDTSSNLFSTSARVVDITTETRTKMDELSHNTEQIQTRTERIELAVQTLVQERLGYQPMNFETIKGRVNRTISRTPKHHFRQYFGLPNADRRQENPADDKFGSSQYSPDTRTLSGSRLLCHGNEDATPSSIGLEHCADKWVKNSLTESKWNLIQNTTFGTISIRTTTVSYVRKVVEDPHSETKQLSTTTVTFLPAPWLISQGAVLRRQRLEFLTGADSYNIPHSTLSTVNIIPDHSEIIQACLRHDLGTICNLFDKGCASPYDVDDAGRNLLGYVAVGVKFNVHEGKHENIQRRVKELDAIITLLIDSGVDPGCLDLDDGNPITLFAICWAEVFSKLPMISPQGDHFKFLFSRLLKSAKSDPFESEALVLVAPQQEYVLDSFPGSVNPGAQILTLQFESLMDQKEWQIILHHGQLEELCSARVLHSSQLIEDVETHVKFWVTSPAQHVENFLYAKLGAIRRFLDYGLLDLKPGGSHCVIEALHTAIHQGGEVIALLTEHEYYGSGHQPWIRHRFRKLVIIERWLTEVIELLLIHGAIDAADPDIVDNFCDHARKHNARTLRVWMKAMRACTEDHPRLSRLKVNIAVSENHSKTTQSDELEEQESDRQWETEDTEGAGSELDTEEDWETEEEWEEGHMLETVVYRDHTDARNPQIKDEECPECHEIHEDMKDYDERYWAHVYPRVIGSNMDKNSPGHSESTLRRLARYAREFISR